LCDHSGKDKPIVAPIENALNFLVEGEDGMEADQNQLEHREGLLGQM
jgi:hypothetical protein